MRPCRLLSWTAGTVAILAVVAAGVTVQARLVTVVSHFGSARPFHHCGPDMVAELEREPLFQAAANEQRRWSPDVQCRDLDDHVAAEAWTDFPRDATAQVIAKRFREAAARSGWTVVPVHGSGPSPTEVLACARKDVRGQAWQGYVIPADDIVGHYSLMIDVDSFETVC